MTAYYTRGMTTADWTERGDYIIAKHGVTPAEANEALADPDAVVFDPDYNSKSGVGVRTIGWCALSGRLLVVITVWDQGVLHGANCWPANRKDQRLYDEGRDDE